MKPEIFDSRKCRLGEGPVIVGTNAQRLYWVDILNEKVLWREIDSDQSGEISTDSHVSFVLPERENSLILGTVDGPIVRGEDGMSFQLPGRTKPATTPIRWNDAKRGPRGELWMGTSAYGADGVSTSLYRLSSDLSAISLQVDELGLANGMDWSPDGKYFYLIDTMGLVLKRFDYRDGEISNVKDVMVFDSTLQEFPDGMTVDGEGCIWIAFWNGGCVRRYSPDFEELFRVELPVRFVTSCAFGGKNVNRLFVTTAIGDGDWHDDSPVAGMTFVVETNFRGKASYT